VASAWKIAVGGDRAAVLDALANEVQILDLAARTSRRFRTGETPIDGVYVGRDLYVLDRDAATVERFTDDGPTTSVHVAEDPAFMRVAGDILYVYSRRGGVVEAIALPRFTIVRRAVIAPFASDFEIAGRTGYLVFPREARIRPFALDTLRAGPGIPVGAVPVDLELASRSNALSAGTLAVADPAAKRVWMIEGAQSMSQAVARGFIRGFLGLGLFGNRDSPFPAGVDRVWSQAGDLLGYDSSTGTLYRIRGAKGSVVAENVSPRSFAAMGSSVVIFQNGRLRLLVTR
jgi:hypothetical protein